MIRSIALSALLLASASVQAQDAGAQLAGVNGQALVNSGEGFQIAVDGTTLATGHLVSIPEGSSAVLVFDDGCRYELEGGTMTSVPEGSPCAGFAINVTRIAPAGTATAGTAAGASSGIPLIAWVPIVGSVAALIYHIDRNDRRTPPLTPVSP